MYIVPFTDYLFSERPKSGEIDPDHGPNHANDQGQKTAAQDPVTTAGAAVREADQSVHRENIANLERRAKKRKKRGKKKRRRPFL